MAATDLRTLNLSLLDVATHGELELVASNLLGGEDYDTFEDT